MYRFLREEKAFFLSFFQTGSTGAGRPEKVKIHWTDTPQRRISCEDYGADRQHAEIVFNDFLYNFSLGSPPTKKKY